MTNTVLSSRPTEAGAPPLRPVFAALIVAFVMSAVLGWQIEQRAAVLRSGSEVLLKTAPVDPRDLLRGDYVTLSYDVSQIPSSMVSGATPETAGRHPLWVRLARQADGFWSATEAAFTPLPPKQDTVVLRTLPFAVFAREGPTTYLVQYGIERFYVPEGEGRAIETEQREKAVTVAVRVASDGRAQIRTLLIDGKPVYDEPLY